MDVFVIPRTHYLPVLYLISSVLTGLAVQAARTTTKTCLQPTGLVGLGRYNMDNPLTNGRKKDPLNPCPPG
ncbi:hypothetical protein F4811DRAFT_544474 [Daldinia bambusicola]|nr:hypothetical protein F4811DRAFT_544474 [Daldinia bambusicola]